MVKLGAHMSIAGGYYKAVDAAAELDMDVVQLFTKNNNQWNAKEISDGEVAQFAKSLKETGVGNPLSHAAALIHRKSAVKPCNLQRPRAVNAGVGGVLDLFSDIEMPQRSRR